MQTIVKSECQVVDCGLISFDEAYALQKIYVERVRVGGNHTLILCEHPNTITLGRLAKEENVLAKEAELEANGFLIRKIDRGGDVTMHLPGQLVVYPIFNLNILGRDLHSFLFRLEQVSIDLLGEFDILAYRNPGRRGAWVEDKKIVSIGIGVRKWISFHGLSININLDLESFSMIKSCDLDVQMTSLEDQNGNPVDMEIVKKKIVGCFLKEFNLKNKDCQWDS